MPKRQVHLRCDRYALQCVTAQLVGIWVITHCPSPLSFALFNALLPTLSPVVARRSAALTA
jgi:hypothetical protein